MTQPKKSSKSKSKKTTTPATSKKVAVLAPEPVLAAKPVVAAAKPVAAKPIAAVKPVVAPVAKPVELAKPAVAAAPVVALPAPLPAQARLISRSEFMELVRKEAYGRAARRNFKNGSPFQDWVNAEAAVSGKLAAQGLRLS